MGISAKAGTSLDGVSGAVRRQVIRQIVDALSVGDKKRIVLALRLAERVSVMTIRVFS